MKVDEGNRLKLFIERENLTQNDVAVMLGKQQSQISKYISGALFIPLEVVKTLHIERNLNYSWFFHGTGPMKVKDKAKATLVTDIVDLNAKIGALEAQVNKLRGLVDILLKDR